MLMKFNNETKWGGIANTNEEREVTQAHQERFEI